MNTIINNNKFSINELKLIGLYEGVRIKDFNAETNKIREGIIQNINENCIEFYDKNFNVIHSIYPKFFNNSLNKLFIPRGKEVIVIY
jgi:hypothetical protein